jgi:predicted transport protein
VSDLKLFRLDAPSGVRELAGEAVALERSLQKLMEENLEALLGVRFLASEYATGKRHAGRIDTLGIDENGCPVIIEYKRSINENVINQGLFYLDWLLDHKSEFWKLVWDALGQKVADGIEWSAPRLLCIAGDFTRYDEHAVAQINRNIELLRYRQFEEGLLLLELVNATTASESSASSTTSAGSGSSSTSRTVSEILSGLSGDLKDLYDLLHDHLKAMGDDVQVKTLKYYVAFKRLKNFACVEVHTGKGCLTCYVKVDPDSVELEEGFSRDVRTIGHFGTGELELILRNRDDFERALPYFRKSYEAS